MLIPKEKNTLYGLLRSMAIMYVYCYIITKNQKKYKIYYKKMCI